MKATVFFLADYAKAHQDGKFYVTGGFLRTIDLSSLPSEYSHLSLGVRIEFAADDIQSSHLVEIHSSGPGSRAFVKPYSLRYRPPEVDDPEPTLLQFVYHMEEVPFSQEGEHSLILLVDDGQIAELTFQVRLSGAAAGVREAEWGDRLQEGVDAFSAGDGVGAEEIFREIIKHRPDLAAARNNLAFIQLSQGKAAEAREQFLEAGRLEFDRSELLDANIACCDYLLSNFTLALARFERCFKARPFTGQSILFGIQEDHLFPVDLESAADYLALMLLNAAWCALRVPAVEKARDYAHRASEFDIVTATPVTQDLPLIARSLALVQGKSGAGPPP